MSCYEILRARGLKLTPQRRLIIEMLHHSEGHLRADSVITEIRSRMPGVNKSTIYRTLDLLEDTGCAVRSEVGGHVVYHHAEEGHHHHLVCSECARTVECPDDLLTPVKARLSEIYGFEADFRHLVIRGLCNSCAKARNDSKEQLVTQK